MPATRSPVGTPLSSAGTLFFVPLPYPQGSGCPAANLTSTRIAMQHPSLPARVRTTGLLLLASLAFESSAFAQKKTETQIRNEIRYARGLVTELGFTDLAQNVLAAVEGDAKDALREELQLAQCEMLQLGARKQRRDPLERNRLYEEALASFEAFIEQNSFSEFVPEAESTFVSLTWEYGQSLVASLESATGEEAVAIKEKLATALERGASKASELASNIEAIPSEERGKADNDTLYKLHLDRGNMLLEMAKSQETGTLFDYALNAFDKVVDLAGEGTPWSLRAFVGTADTYMAMGEPEEAEAFYAYVCSEAIPIDRDEWETYKKDAGIDAATAQTRFLFVQLGITGWLESLLALGDLEGACNAGMYFHNIWKREGFNLTDGLGHMAMLQVARTLLDAGGNVGGDFSGGEAEWFPTEDAMKEKYRSARQQKTAVDVSLSLAQQVNREMAGNVLQIQAQQLIGQIIELPGMVPDPSILYEAAEGEYNAQNFGEALPAFKRVLASLQSQDAALRSEFAPQIFFYMGSTYQKLDLHMEAIMAFEQCIQLYPADSNYTPDCAKRLLFSARRLKTVSKGPEVDKLYRKAENYMIEYASEEGGVGDIEFGKAERAYDAASKSKSAADFAEAKRLFGEVSSDASKYELARVHIGLCDYQVGNYPGAEFQLTEYLETFVNDPVNAVNTAAQRARREKAMALATLYMGLCAVKQSNWSDVVERLDGFEDKFPNAQELTPAAVYRRLLAQLELGDDAAVLREEEILRSNFKSSKFAAAGSRKAYDVVKARYEASEEGSDERRTALQSMARLREAGNSSGNPSYAYLRQESQHWMELEEWAKAERVLRKIREDFAMDADPAVRAALEQHVPSDLGWALMEQRELEEALSILQPLVEAEKAGPSTATRFALCVSGWLDVEQPANGGPLKVTAVPGMGDADSFPKAVETLRALEPQARWEDKWYANRIDTIFAYYQWSKLDSERLRSANTILTSIKQQASGDNPGEEFSLVENERLRAQFLWLDRQVR